jgi:hypothetical protein
MATVWRKCSSCKNDILTGQNYFVCSVSTCQGKNTNYAFCSIPCWDAHVPVERHRGDTAGAIERKAPSTVTASPTPEAARRVIPATSGQNVKAPKGEDDVLVVVTKVRKYIADKSGMNTSASVYDMLTEKIKVLCDNAIDVARADARKTVMDRDFK